ncbi:MAG: TetR/AcrR family transcriptional regulator [Rhodothermales bacterium]
MPVPAPVPVWRHREQEARRASLLLAARAVFAERGYHEATVEEIAALADIGKGTVYLHFPEGKAGLLETVLDDHLAALRGIVVRTFTEGEGAVRYRFWTLALAAATYFRRNPDLLRVHVRELPRLLADAEVGPVAECLARLTDELVDVVAPVLQEDRLTLPSRVAAYHLLATLFGHLIALGLQTGPLDCGTPPAEIADTLVALVFDGIAGHRTGGG